MSVPSYNGYAKIPSMSSCLMTLVTWTRGRKVPRVELSNRAFTRSATQNETRVPEGTEYDVLRMSPERMLKVALRWTPAGKRKRGRPKTTWRKTVETELSEMGLSWGEAQAIAKDKTSWKRDIVVALCSTGGNTDWWWWWWWWWNVLRKLRWKRL